MAAIISSEIVFRYSVKSGSAGNTVAGTANGSLGTYISTTAWAGGSANDLFDDISGAENAASTVDYRCVFVYNSNGANALQNAVVYISAEVAGGASISLAADTTATSALGASPAQALTGTTETAPGAGVTGLTYSSPTTSATGISLGSIPSGSVKAFWLKRTAANSAALSGTASRLRARGTRVRCKPWQLSPGTQQPIWTSGSVPSTCMLTRSRAWTRPERLTPPPLSPPRKPPRGLTRTFWCSAKERTRSGRRLTW